MNIKKFLQFSFLALLIVCSCTIQKRAYRNGYYIAWNKNAEKSEKRNNPAAGFSKNNKKADIAQVNLGPKEKNNVPAQLLASIKAFIPKPVFTSIKTYLDNCDTLFFKSGKMVAAKVIEITSTEVKYKYCNNQDGPLYVSSKNELSQINFASGQKEIFEGETVQPQPHTVKQNIDSISKSEKERKKNNLSTWFIMFLIGLAVTIGLGLLLPTSGVSGSIGSSCLIVLGIIIAGLFTVVAFVGMLVTFFIWLAA